MTHADTTTKLPPVVHVAGSKGKGSTAAFLASILHAAEVPATHGAAEVSAAKTSAEMASTHAPAAMAAASACNSVGGDSGTSQCHGNNGDRDSAQHGLPYGSFYSR